MALSAPPGFVWFACWSNWTLLELWEFQFSMSHFLPFTGKMHESLTFKAGLRVLTGDVGPHASRVLARLIIIFALLEPTEPFPQSHPLQTASETAASCTDLGLTRTRVIQRDSINAATRGHRPGGRTVQAGPQVCPYLAAVVVPEPLLQRLSQLAQQEAVV